MAAISSFTAAPSVVWGSSTAARGSGAAPGAPPPWGSPSPATNGRPAAGARRRTGGDGPTPSKGKGEKSGGAHQDPPTGVTAGRPAGHCRRRRRRHRHRAPCIGHLRGGCGLGETLPATPVPTLLFYGAWAGWANQPTQAINRPAGPQAALSSSVSEVRWTPLNFQQVQKKPLNLNLALRLLFFIYSDLLMLYIYVLGLELFCNFML
jgi:hypothetical protein